MTHNERDQSQRGRVADMPDLAAVTLVAESALRSHRWLGTLFAALALRVDNFRIVNDTLGHASGDAMLGHIGTRITEVVAGRGFVAHHGTDEFVVLLPACGPGEAQDIARSLVALLREPITLEGVDVSIHTSIGIASTGHGNRTAALLLQAADLALWETSRSGNHAVEMFTPAVRTRASSARRSAEAVSKAVRRREFSYHYQPIVELGRGDVVGVEALMRWESGRPDLRSPARFISILDSLGELTGVSEQLLPQALAQLQRWRVWHPELALSVNLNPSAVEEAEVVNWLRHLPEATGLPNSALILEVSESAMASTRSVTNLGILHRAGLGVWLDDFGTGWSSLAALRRLPLDAMKLARPFLFANDGAVDVEMVAAVMAIADAAGLQAVAEGIETKEQLAQVRAQGIALGQGFHLARPMPADALDRWLTTYQPTVASLA